MSYTINPNAKNRWARNAENTMDLSLETDASSVYLENGRTLEQELGEGSIASNVTTVDSSVNKVIDGTLDGAYESLTFKGKSLVNIHPISYAMRVASATTYFANKDVDKTKIKSGTRYFLRLLNTDPTVCSAYFKPCNVTTISFANINDKYAIFTTKSELTDSDLSNNKIHFYTNTGKTLEDVVNTKIILCEYQEGMENWDIPYFTGLCDSKMPILRNVGKNLLDINTLPIKVGRDICQIANGVVYSKPTAAYEPVRWIIPVEPNTTYTVSAVGSANAVLQFSNFFNTSDPSLDARISYQGSERKATTFTTATHTSITMSLFSALVKDLSIGNIQLEKESVNTTYEDYKTNILRTSEEIVLREVNGVQDTYNALTGEYVQRIGEVVVTNTVSKSVVVLDNNIRVNIAMSSLNGSDGTTKVNNTLSDKFYWSEANAKDVEGLRVNGNTFHWCINKDRLTSQDLQGVNTWLQSNPITVQYHLAEPVTTIVEPLTIPFAYQNGHIILESGYEGQSLLPMLEYSTVVNKTGLIENVAKTIQKQEKQITKLEQMLIQNIINLDYNNTLLALKNEMEEML